MAKIELTFVSRENMEFNDSQKEYLLSASKILEDVINTNVFKNKIRDFKYKRGRRWHQGFRLNKGFSGKEILDILLSGKDPYDSKDQVLNIHVNPYYKNKVKYHARTFSKRRSIGINTTYLDYCIANNSYGKINIPKTLLHEYMHILGFKHYTNSGKKRDMPTVPWGMGNTVRDILK